jgi:hypothetical protein
VNQEFNLEKDKLTFSQAFTDPEDDSKRIDFNFNFSKAYDTNWELKD